jgi:hypothetical protein
MMMMMIYVLIIIKIRNTSTKCLAFNYLHITG